VGALNDRRILGTVVPVEERSTASRTHASQQIAPHSPTKGKEAQRAVDDSNDDIAKNLRREERKPGIAKGKA
jgi:hypothetical protein